MKWLRVRVTFAPREWWIGFRLSWRCWQNGSVRGWPAESDLTVHVCVLPCVAVTVTVPWERAPAGTGGNP